MWSGSKFGVIFLRLRTCKKWWSRLRSFDDLFLMSRIASLKPTGLLFWSILPEIDFPVPCLIDVGVVFLGCFCVSLSCITVSYHGGWMPCFTFSSDICLESDLATSFPLQSLCGAISVCCWFCPTGLDGTCSYMLYPVGSCVCDIVYIGWLNGCWTVWFVW